MKGLHEVVRHIIGAQRGVGYERSGTRLKTHRLFQVDIGFLAFQRENACPSFFVIRRRFHPFSCGHDFKTTLFENVTAENVQKRLMTVKDLLQV